MLGQQQPQLSEAYGCRISHQDDPRSMPHTARTPDQQTSGRPSSECTHSHVHVCASPSTVRARFSGPSDFLRLASPASVREMMAWGESHADKLDDAGGLHVLRDEHAPKGKG